MSDTPQEARPLQVALPDVPDAGLVLTAFSGTEGVSRLYSYALEFAVPVAAPLTFDQMLGQVAVVTIRQTGDATRFVHGLLCRLTQGRRDNRYISYTAELVPPLWVLTRNRRSRIFQHQTTEEILREVIGGVYDLSDAFQLSGTYHPRNICVQYHESDFAFVSRLAEEEGWYFYFTHTADSHGIVISDNPRGHKPVPGANPLHFRDADAGSAPEGRITRWVKAQSLRPVTFNLTDHSFEMPTNRLEAAGNVPESVAAGTAQHTTGWTNAGELPVVQHPGGYVRWRDGVGPGGADRPDDLEKVFEDNARIARVRAQAAMTEVIHISGASTFVPLTAGLTFALADHPDADGEYLLTAVSHAATCGEASSGGDDFRYSNTFECIPQAVPFRPRRVTPRPAIHGTQTGVVVGSDGAEIDPDKYGRVKVWFRWDPEGQRGLDTSCWVRVAQFWAGRQWGAQFIPRVGDEVVVAFLNGDPDQPIIIGSVYNADNMPIYTLPDNKTQSGIKTHSSTGGDSQTFNELKFEDKKGSELVSIHAEKDMNITIEDNYTINIGGHQKDPHKAGKSSSTTFGDTSYTVTKGDYSFSVSAGKAEYFVKGPVTETFDDTQATTVTNSIDVRSKTSFIHLTSPTEIKLSVGKNTHITLTPDQITLHSPHIKFEGTTDIIAETPALQLEGKDKVTMFGADVGVDGKSKAVFQSSAGKADFVASTKATLGVSGQTVVCDASKVAVSGAMIQSKASGVCEIAGSLVKIN